MMSEAKNKRLSSNSKALKILIDCIKQNLSDESTQQRLIKECGYKWTIDTIRRRRRAMGVKKKSGKPTDTDMIDTPMLEALPYGLTDSEKANWFRNQLKKTHLYRTINKQFESEEVSVYMEDFGLLCCQFEDIVISEFMQVDDFLKHRILIDQQLIMKKSLQRQIDELQVWFIANPKADDENKDTIKFRILQQRQLDDKYRYLKTINDRYDALVKERQKIYSSLCATRKDRIEELKGGKATFFELVSKLQHSQNERDRQGRFAELTKLASNDIKNEFRKPIKFPDGSIEPVIMDAETDFGEEEYE
ncbi:hypothetical protein LCGC14_0219690 [marine sediment metagenome]|uniref:Uncharacterized protein n=1 Tax=marine sediment metagenome TaxID=412755 RepID=A0A0F9UHG2_9ZZZZ